MSSRIPGFYRLGPRERLRALVDCNEELARDAELVWSGEGLTLTAADLMVENVIGTFSLPQAVAVNFLINGQDVLVPMVVEEPSVVAAASNMARLTRMAGGLRAEADPSVMAGQVEVLEDHSDDLEQRLRAAMPQLEALAKGMHPRLVERGGGLRGLELRSVDYREPGYPEERRWVLQFYLDCVDAMGANMVNTVAEAMGRHLVEQHGCQVGLRILSNLTDRRLARAEVLLPYETLGEGSRGRQIAEGIALAYRFAWADPYRAATHNKGIFNGIDALALATGNDWRALEAGAHAYAARDGQYRPLSSWRCTPDGLRGFMELPMAVGVVGGPIRVHPTVQSNLKLLGSPRAQELAAIMAAVGLTQNLGALRALAGEGIQRGHMRMHARNVVASAGVESELVPEVAQRLWESGDFSVERARAIAEELRQP